VARDAAMALKGLVAVAPSSSSTTYYFGNKSRTELGLGVVP
jgi:hypothetical protein